jgi:hypothetical protein
MGLDMFACTTPEKPSSEVDFKTTQWSELHYWRKHPNLHGWMEQLYCEKGGSNADFNCGAVQLNLADLDLLEADIREQRLPRTGGFFFGASDGSKSEMEDDLAFVAKARQALADNLTVYYTSWW